MVEKTGLGERIAFVKTPHLVHAVGLQDHHAADHLVVISEQRPCLNDFACAGLKIGTMAGAVFLSQRERTGLVEAKA